METRQNSPPSRASSPPRPNTQRKRSNSFPLVEALGCSTPEAELILAEGRAAVRSRHALAHRRGRRNLSANDQILPFRPQDHIGYLDQRLKEDVTDTTPTINQSTDSPHARIPSNITDRSGSTITGLTPRIAVSSPALSPTTPLGDYSANLAKFIQTQLDSIAAHHQPTISPRSCPDLTFKSRTPPLSPTAIAKRPTGAPSIIEIPPVRPPLRSAFSAWSSTDDEAEQNPDDDLPPLPFTGPASKESKAKRYTPSILQYYASSNNSSFLFSSTPLDERESGEHPNAEGFSFPLRPTAPAEVSETSTTQYETDYPSSALSSRPQLTTSSAPSFSSTSTGSYFDCKRPIAFAPHVRDRIVAAVSPRSPNQKTLHATSPFEGGALANVHDILIESQRRVLVDGLSFDLMHNINIPEAIPRVTTPC